MADPIIRIKRSSVEGKIPTPDQVPLGEVALNTFDGKFYASKNVGLGTTVFTVNPWTVGTGTNTYNTYFTVGNVGIGSTLPSSTLEVVGDAKFTGIVTAINFVGDGSNLTGIVTYITAGSGISVNQNTGNVTITATGGGGGGGGESYWTQTDVGIHTLGSVGIGTTNPTAKLQVLASDSGSFGISAAPNTATSSVSIQNTLGDVVLFLGNDNQVSAGLGTLANNGAVITFGGKFSSTSLTQNRGFGAIGAYKENNTSANQQGYLSLYTRPSSGNLVERVRIDSSGNVGIGTTNPTSKLTVSGDVLVVGVITATDFNSSSDITLKNNIFPIKNPIDKIIRINGVNFEWKENNKKSAGVIAQEVENIMPELIGGNETKTVNYNGLIGLLIEVVKDQQKQIDEIKKNIGNYK